MSGLIPVRQLLDGDGIDWRRCLAGTGIAPADLDRDGLTVTLRQEDRLFGNLLALTGDPAIGLRLGRQYSPQRYGLFGYAMLSAPTLRHALVIATRFGEDLTFTWLRFGLDIGGREVVFSLGDRTYAETFNFGGKKFDKILEECGAHRIGTVFTHDASAGTVPEDEGVKWVTEWAKLCAGAKAEAA